VDLERNVGVERMGNLSIGLVGTKQGDYMADHVLIMMIRRLQVLSNSDIGETSNNVWAKLDLFFGVEWSLRIIIFSIANDSGYGPPLHLGFPQHCPSSDI
jgi:hypothetical protein